MSLISGTDPRTGQLLPFQVSPSTTAETGFGQVKLDSELVRAAFQFRFFADVVREGGFLEAAIDHAGSTPIGPRPDLRRILVPIGRLLGPGW
jgi:hypothetical protein